MKTLALPLCAAFLLGSSSAARGDTTAPGFFIESEIPISIDAAFASLPGDGVLVFDGVRIFSMLEHGRFHAYYGGTPGFVYPSFVLVHPTQGYALIGESSNGDVFAVSHAADGLRPVINLPLNYAAVWEDARHFLVSAAPCVLFCGNEIWRVDATTGARELVASVNGPSGPLAVSSNGDLYCGIFAAVYPPPPGSVGIVRWSAASVHSGTPLTEANGQYVVTGLDGLSSMSIDPVEGHLWATESRFPGGSEVLEFLLDGTPRGQVLTSPDWIANLEATDRGSRGAMRTWPASTRLRLRYSAVDYSPGGGARLVTVLPIESDVPEKHW